MDQIENLQSLIIEPIEELHKEYKYWLDLRNEEHRETLAKAAIAMVNYGGGFIITGFEQQQGALISKSYPDDIPIITQDSVNNAIQKYAEPRFHCKGSYIQHRSTNVPHVVISTPGTLTVPVMSKDKTKSIAANCCYIRKSGPCSEGPCTPEEMRALLRRCVLANRHEMLESIRSIVLGRIEVKHPIQNALTELHDYSSTANNRWKELISDQLENSPLRLPYGHYEMGFSLVDVTPVGSFNALQDKLRVARRIGFTGRPPFSQLSAHQPHMSDNLIEMHIANSVASVRKIEDPSYWDFWCASFDGKLYTIRGYSEDESGSDPGKTIDVSTPIWRVGEGLLFASRLAETFEEAEQIAIQCRFTGLKNRTLVSDPRRYSLYGGSVSSTGEVLLEHQVTLQQVQDNLPEIIHKLLSPFYERFNFFKLPLELVQSELRNMRGK